MGEVFLRLKVWILILLMLLLLTGCTEKTNEEIFYKAQKQMIELDTYVCTADITIFGNKSPEKYTAKQWFKAPDKYRIEIQSPDEVKGKITIYNGKKAFVCHPRIGQEWLVNDFSTSVENKIFIGYFLNNFVNTENTEVNKETIGDRDYILIQTEIPGNHPYFNKERLWFDIKNYYPYKLQVLDKDDGTRIEVRYIDFKFNEKIEDNMFTIKSSK